MSNSPYYISDETLCDAIEDLLPEHRDLARGGIHPTVLASELDRDRSGLRDRVNELVDAGELVRVWGVAPDGSQPRIGYLPADHPDAGGEVGEQ